MACTYSSIEIQRTPEFRVYKKCMFYDRPCAEVRGSGKCPLLKHTTVEEAVKIAPAPRDDRAMLNEELQRFDGIPSVGGEFKSPEGARVSRTEQIEKANSEAATSEVELLKAELSDFMEKIETKKEKTTAHEKSSASKKVQSESIKAKKTEEK